jgi:hypothetical protein
MQVTAISTPVQPNWRWRITNDACEIIEESRPTFPTIATAIAEGTKRLRAMNVVDRSIPPPRFPRSTSHLRGR